MKLRFDSGENAEGSAFDGNLFTLFSPRAFAPGSPIRFVATFDDGERSLEGRVLGSKRVDDDRFEVRMRFVNLRRTDRENLVAQLET